MRIKDFVFQNSDFPEKIQKIMHDKKYQQRLTDFAREIKQKRNWDAIGELYYHEIFE